MRGIEESATRMESERTVAGCVCIYRFLISAILENKKLATAKLAVLFTAGEGQRYKCPAF